MMCGPTLVVMGTVQFSYGSSCSSDDFWIVLLKGLLRLKLLHCFFFLLWKHALTVIYWSVFLLQDDVQSLLKTLQLSTRQLHHMCGHSKVSSNCSTNSSCKHNHFILFLVFPGHSQVLIAVLQCVSYSKSSERRWNSRGQWPKSWSIWFGSCLIGCQIRLAYPIQKDRFLLLYCVSVGDWGEEGRRTSTLLATWAASACPKGDFTCAALFLSRSSEVQEHISEKSLSKAVEAWLHKVDWLAV